MASSGRFVRILSRVQAAGLALLVALLALTSGCDTRIGNGTVSTSTFESLALTDSVHQQAIQVLSDKIDLLKSISPTTVEAVLNEQQANTFPLGTLNLAPGGRSSVLIFEANLRAICSVDLCDTGTCQLTVPRVQLHYNDVGVEEDPFADPVEEKPKVKTRKKKAAKAEDTEEQPKSDLNDILSKFAPSSDEVDDNE